MRCARRRKRAISRGQRLRWIAVPAVRADEHDRTAHRVPVMRGQQRSHVGRDPGAAEPVGHLRGGLRDRHFRRFVRQHAGQPRQPRREREDLGVGGQGERAHQMQVGHRLRLHRLADVAQHHDTARLVHAPGADEPDRFPARRSRAGQRGPQRDAVSPAVDRNSTGSAPWPSPYRRLQVTLQPDEVGVAELVEGQVGEAGQIAWQQVRHHRVDVAPVVGHGGGQGGPRQAVGLDLRRRRGCLVRPVVDARLAGRGAGASRVGVQLQHGVLEDRGEHGVEDRQFGQPTDEAHPRGPVQPRPRRRRRHRQSLGEIADGREPDVAAPRPQPGGERHGERRAVDATEHRRGGHDGASA